MSITADAGNETSVSEGFSQHPFVPVIAIFMVLTYTSVALRLWVRRHFTKHLGRDDAFIIVALVFFSIYCSTLIALFILVGSARGLQSVRDDDVKPVTQLLLCVEIFYIFTMIALKLSLAFFFLRILVTRWQRLLIITAVTASSAFGVAETFFAIFQCGYTRNVDVFIERMLAGTCAPQVVGMAMNTTFAVLTTISDWICGLLPIFMLRNSNLPLKTKFAVGGLLAFAAVGSVASVVRITFIPSITISTGHFFDRVSLLAIWSIIEPGIGITVASLATLRPLFKCLFEKTRNLTANHRTSISKRSTSLATFTTAGDGDFRRASETTTVVSSPGAKSDEEKDIEMDNDMAMRAYGMRDFAKCATLTNEDFRNLAPDEVLGRSRIFGSQWAPSSGGSDREVHDWPGGGEGGDR